MIIELSIIIFYIIVLLFLIRQVIVGRKFEKEVVS